MDAITLIQKDHQAVEALFRRFEKTGARARPAQRKLVEQMITALSQHMAIEEALLYPLLRAAFDDEDVLKALEEHHVFKWTLSELEHLQPSDERFRPKVLVLIDLVRRHVEEEEARLLPVMRERVEPRLLRDLGVRLERARARAPTHPHPRSPDAPPGNRLATPMAAALDRGLDLVRGLVQSRRDQAEARGRKAVRGAVAARKGRKRRR